MRFGVNALQPSGQRLGIGRYEHLLKHSAAMRLDSTAHGTLGVMRRMGSA